MREFQMLLLMAPDTQLDESVKPLIEKWSDPPKALEILEVVDQVVRYALGSDFTVRVFDHLLKAAIVRESTTMEEVVKQATWRE